MIIRSVLGIYMETIGHYGGLQSLATRLSNLWKSCDTSAA